MALAERLREAPSDSAASRSDKPVVLNACVAGLSKLRFSSSLKSPKASSSSRRLKATGETTNVLLNPMDEHWVDRDFVSLRIDNVTKDLNNIIISQQGYGEFGIKVLSDPTRSNSQKVSA